MTPVQPQDAKIGDALKFPRPKPENIPSELTEKRHFVLWREESREDKRGNRQATKVPYQTNGRHAKPNDPSTWAGFDEVMDVYNNGGGYDGIGFCLGEGTPIGIDLDHCCCPAFDNVILPWAQDIIERMDSYAETSPSGKGIRIFVNGGPLPCHGRKKGPVEIYESGRYLTVTGRHIPGTPTTINHRPEAVIALHRQYFGRESEDSVRAEVLPPESDPDIEDRLRKAFASQHGKKIKCLYDGDWSDYPSQSEADLALCSYLAFWLGKDAGLMDRAFRSSGLMRPKWDVRHSSDGRTYGQSVVEKAVSSCGDIYRDNAVASSAQSSPYFVDPQGFWCRLKQTQNGTIPVRLANFTARIDEEILEDDGVEVLHRYLLKGQMTDRALPAIDVPASSFAALNWLPKWGSRAIIEPGQSTKDFVRHAIQMTSADVRKSTRYTHTGWREIDGAWIFLTSGGGIGGGNITVKLSPEMSRYALPIQPENESEAIRASLSFLDIGNREVTTPLFVMTYLAPLTSQLEPTPNFSGYVYGPTGTFKTTLSLLQLSHFGDFSTIANLPNFDDTANSLEKRGFTLKDVFMVLDDYHPSERRSDAMQKGQIAQRIIRAYANRTARGRLNSDTSDKGRYAPRGFLQVTGEEIVTLQSTLARVFVVEIQPGDINIQKMTELQGKAHLLPHAMCSFILWVRDHMEEIKKSFPGRFGELRSQSSQAGFHRKLPEQVAFLMFALETACGWLLDRGIISNEEAYSLADEGWDVFTRLSERHSRRIAEDSPVTIFEEVMETLFIQGKVRLEHRAKFGETYGGNDGVLLGYFDDRFLYLLPAPMWHELSRFCISEGTHFPFSKNTFYRMLRDRKLIEPGLDGQSTTTLKVHGKTVRVLKFVGGGMLKNAVSSVTGVVEE